MTSFARQVQRRAAKRRYADYRAAYRDAQQMAAEHGAELPVSLLPKKKAHRVALANDRVRGSASEGE